MVLILAEFHKTLKVTATELKQLQNLCLFRLARIWNWFYNNFAFVFVYICVWWRVCWLHSGELYEWLSPARVTTQSLSPSTAPGLSPTLLVLHQAPGSRGAVLASLLAIYCTSTSCTVEVRNPCPVLESLLALKCTCTSCTLVRNPCHVHGR